MACDSCDLVPRAAVGIQGTALYFRRASGAYHVMSQSASVSQNVSVMGSSRFRSSINITCVPLKSESLLACMLICETIYRPKTKLRTEVQEPNVFKSDTKIQTLVAI